MFSFSRFRKHCDNLINSMILLVSLFVIPKCVLMGVMLDPPPPPPRIGYGVVNWSLFLIWGKPS